MAGDLAEPLHMVAWVVILSVRREPECQPMIGPSGGQREKQLIFHDH